MDNRYKNKVFYVEDLKQLEKYGFKKDIGGHYRWYRNRTVAMQVLQENHFLSFFSPSRDAIEVICKMYKDGVLQITEQTKLRLVEITQEEWDMVLEERRKKYEERQENI